VVQPPIDRNVIYYLKIDRIPSLFIIHSSFLFLGQASRRHNDLELLQQGVVFQANSDRIYAGIWDETNSR
jgi:hypothetical protein